MTWKKSRGKRKESRIQAGAQSCYFVIADADADADEDTNANASKDTHICAIDS